MSAERVALPTKAPAMVLALRGSSELTSSRSSVLAILPIDLHWEIMTKRCHLGSVSKKMMERSLFTLF